MNKADNAGNLTPSRLPPIKNKNRVRWGKDLIGYAFIAPNFILLSIFTIFPMLFSLVISFTEWDFLSGFEKIKFVGLDNFKKMTTDIYFSTSVINNIVFTALYIPLLMIVSLFFAILLNEYVFGKNVLRLFIFLPYITNMAAVAIIWIVLYGPYGPIAGTLEALGLTTPTFLADIKWAMPAIVIMNVWKFFGYNSLILLAGLQNIPTELYEAAYIDGVNSWRKLTRITLPLLTPTLFFVIITSVIGSFQVFGQIQIMTNGGPVRSTYVMVLLIYNEAFTKYNFGYASALALVLFVAILFITIIQWWGQKKWVNY